MTAVEAARAYHEHVTTAGEACYKGNYNAAKLHFEKAEEVLRCLVEIDKYIERAAVIMDIHGQG